MGRWGEVSSGWDGAQWEEECLSLLKIWEEPPLPLSPQIPVLCALGTFCQWTVMLMAGGDGRLTTIPFSSRSGVGGREFW